MASEREAGFPIEDFGGVNLLSDSEDLTPNQLLEARNLWEKTLGQLETRYGSETALYAPSGVTANKVGNIFKLYKNSGETRRFCAVKCTQDTGTTTLPTGVTLSFVTAASGYWNNDNTIGGTTFSMQHVRILLRFVGFGVDKWYAVDSTAVTGYSATTNQKLRVAVDATFDNAKTTGIEVYTTVASGVTEVAGAISSVSNYQRQTMWVGFIDVTTDDTQTVDFFFAPVGYDGTIGAGTDVGESERSFVVSAYASGFNNVTGTFKGGKTYYVAILPQYMDFTAGSGSRACYRQPNCDVWGGEVVPITIPGSTTGYIKISSISPNTACFLIAIGETPQTLQPHSIFNNSAGVGGIANLASTPTVANLGEFWVENPPANNPGVIDIFYTGDGVAHLQFRMSDFSTQDMFMGINDDDTRFPIFCSRLTKQVNSQLEWYDVLGDGALTASSPSTSIPSYPYVKYLDQAPSYMQKMGSDSVYHFATWEDYCFFVNDNDPLLIPQVTVSSVTYPAMPHRTNSNYFICDGRVAATVIEDVNLYTFTGGTTSGANATLLTAAAKQDWVGRTLTITSGTNFTPGTYTVISVTTGVGAVLSATCASGVGADGIFSVCDSLTLPNAKYITKFDSSILLGGGTPSIDPLTGLSNESSKTIYFSRALNPYDFTDPTQGAVLHQTISMDDDQENIVGFGIYTNTTSDSGPQSYLVTGKKNALWILNSLPIANDDGNALLQATNRILSKKVGAYHKTFVNTPIGTMCASNEGVWLLRADGEPSPIGDEISPLLKAADMTKAVACYHDDHYKIAFSHPDYTGYNAGASNNVEMWLNIKKIVQTKASDWVGPMIGRAIDYVFVEDREGDGDIYNSARTRYAIDRARGVGRVYRADVTPAATAATLYDLQVADGDASNSEVTSILETKNFDISQQDNNWEKLLKRLYVKARHIGTWVASDATCEIFADGTSAGEVDLLDTFTADAVSEFYDKPLSLKRFFPDGRIRGRTFKLKFEFLQRIGIGGFQLNYQVSKRRL